MSANPAGGADSKARLRRSGRVCAFARLGRVTKRVRGGSRSSRPGTRPPSERPAARRRLGDVEAPSQLEAATEIAESVVEGRPASAADTLERVARQPAARQPVAHQRHRPKPGSLLAERAANEYVYVAQDMRRILIVAGGLTVILFALWLLIVVMRVIELPFY